MFRIDRDEHDDPSLECRKNRQAGLEKASAEDPADLLDVIGIVARHMPGQIPDSDPSALGMNSEAFPLLGRELL